MLDLLGKGVFYIVPEETLIVIPVILIIFGVHFAISLAATFIGIGLNSFILSQIYVRMRDCGVPVDQITKDMDAEPAAPRAVRPFVWISVTLALLVALGWAGYSISTVDMEDHVEITAHRGSSLRAPENTLSAIEAAIEDGADYAEIDVQETADGQIVVFHDEDFLRLAGDNRKIWDLDYAEIRSFDVGSWFGPEFEGEKVPALSEAIELARGRIKLNIELKYNKHQQMLADRVVHILHEKDFVSQTLITSLRYRGLKEIRKKDPDIRIGFIVAKDIGRLRRRDFDVLSVASGMGSADLIATTQGDGREVHVKLRGLIAPSEISPCGSHAPSRRTARWGLSV
ncbi:glycerophosphodiester phosphodiesterase family protein [Acidobacteriota bacterium]